MSDWPPTTVDWVRCVLTAHFDDHGTIVPARCHDTFGHEGRCTVIDPATFEEMLVPEGASW